MRSPMKQWRAIFSRLIPRLGSAVMTYGETPRNCSVKPQPAVVVLEQSACCAPPMLLFAVSRAGETNRD